MSLKWIAKRLHRGAWIYVSDLLNLKSPTLPQKELLRSCQG